jgi:uncharacterized OB-fold protein
MNDTSRAAYLPTGLPIPVPESDGLSAPYWEGLQQNRLLVQRCSPCSTWQFGPEWLCHHCHSFDLHWVAVEPRGRVFSWQRVWSPSHNALRQHGPYIAVLVELLDAGNVRMVGNLLGDPMQAVTIGAGVEGVFEHHLETRPTYSLLQWQLTAA